MIPHRAIVPILTAESGLTRYLEQIQRFPMLEAHEEYMLAKCWREQGDRNAAQRLVTSHLRLVAKIAIGYRGYGLPISEVISEGNIGLMRNLHDRVQSLRTQSSSTSYFRQQYRGVDRLDGGIIQLTFA